MKTGSPKMTPAQLKILFGKIPQDDPKIIKAKPITSRNPKKHDDKILDDFLDNLIKEHKDKKSKALSDFIDDLVEETRSKKLKESKIKKLKESKFEKLEEATPLHDPIKKNIKISTKKSKLPKNNDKILMDFFDDLVSENNKLGPEFERLKKTIEWGDNKIAEIRQNIRELKKQKQTKVNIKYIESLNAQIEFLLRTKSEIIQKIGNRAKFKKSDEFRYIKELADDLLIKKKEVFQKMMGMPKDLQNIDNPEYDKLSKKYQRINNQLYELKDYFPDSWAKKNKVIGFGLPRKLKRKPKKINML